jgi:hypothetical protein
MDYFLIACMAEVFGGTWRPCIPPFAFNETLNAAFFRSGDYRAL